MGCVPDGRIDRADGDGSEVTGMSKCISCEFIVMDEKKGGTGLCWKQPESKRVLIDTIIERKCDKYKLGAMQNVRMRNGWKP